MPSQNNEKDFALLREYEGQVLEMLAGYDLNDSRRFEAIKSYKNEIKKIATKIGFAITYVIEKARIKSPEEIVRESLNGVRKATKQKVDKVIPQEKPAYYATPFRAKLAVEKLKIKNREEYALRYSEDRLLPEYPKKVYGNEWGGWDFFLGLTATPEPQKQKKYKTYEEAQAGAQKLGIKKYKEFIKRYKEDPMLPSHPHLEYGEKLGKKFSYRDFLRNEPEIYDDFEETKLAARKIGATGAMDFRKKCALDPRLPTKPFIKFAAVWKGWDDFLDLKEKPKLYENYWEAKESVLNLGIKNWREYLKRRQEDPRLPSNPDKFAPFRNDWVSWDEFWRPDEFGERKSAVRKIVKDRKGRDCAFVVK
jgi:hypothetical protein